MSAWMHSGNSSLEPRKKADLSLNGNPLLAAEKGFKESLDFTLAFQMHFPLIKCSGWGCQEPPLSAAPSTLEGGGVMFVPWVRKNKTLLVAEELRLDSVMNNLAGHKVGSK